MNGSSILIMVFFLVFFWARTPQQLIRKRVYDILIFMLGIYGERVYSYVIYLVNKYEYEIDNMTFLVFLFIMLLFMQDRE